jgi:hypothetical protein
VGVCVCVCVRGSENFDGDCDIVFV